MFGDKTESSAPREPPRDLAKRRLLVELLGETVLLPAVATEAEHHRVVDEGVAFAQRTMMVKTKIVDRATPNATVGELAENDRFEPRREGVHYTVLAAPPPPRTVPRQGRLRLRVSGFSCTLASLAAVGLTVAGVGSSTLRRLLVAPHAHAIDGMVLLLGPARDALVAVDAPPFRWWHEDLQRPVAGHRPEASLAQPPRVVGTASISTRPALIASSTPSAIHEFLRSGASDLAFLTSGSLYGRRGEPP